mmetsp:Transcript_34416/g.73299  ORF Transcript_34416/g.73299 Transcript_34416/m.73299 type:complete len:287 (-) Transcript_34416:339-1199(-)
MIRHAKPPLFSSCPFSTTSSSRRPRTTATRPPRRPRRTPPRANRRGARPSLPASFVPRTRTARFRRPSSRRWSHGAPRPAQLPSDGMFRSFRLRAPVWLFLPPSLLDAARLGRLRRLVATSSHRGWIRRPCRPGRRHPRRRDRRRPRRDAPHPRPPRWKRPRRPPTARRTRSNRKSDQVGRGRRGGRRRRPIFCRGNAGLVRRRQKIRRVASAVLPRREAPMSLHVASAGPRELARTKTTEPPPFSLKIARPVAVEAFLVDHLFDLLFLSKKTMTTTKPARARQSR